MIANQFFSCNLNLKTQLLLTVIRGNPAEAALVGSNETVRASEQ